MNPLKKSDIDELLLRWEDLAEHGDGATLEELCAESPELLDELRRRVCALQWMDSLLDTDSRIIDTHAEGRGTAHVPVSTVLSTTQRFAIRRQVGRGGRAEIYVTNWMPFMLGNPGRLKSSDSICCG